MAENRAGLDDTTSYTFLDEMIYKSQTINYFNACNKKIINFLNKKLPNSKLYKLNIKSLLNIA